MMFSDYSWLDFIDTDRSTLAFFLIKVDQLIVAQMFQDQLINQLLKVITMQDALK